MTDNYALFNAKAHLETYYCGDPIHDFGEMACLEHYVSLYQQHRPIGRHLEIGCGGAIYTFPTLARSVDRIIATDISLSAVQEVESWMHDQGHNWDLYFSRILELEGSYDSIESRKQLVRDKVSTAVLDICTAPTQKYESVSAQFVAASTTTISGDFNSVVDNIANYVSSNGLLNIAFLLETNTWKSSNGDTFSCFNLSYIDALHAVTSRGFSIIQQRFYGSGCDDRVGGSGKYVLFGARKRVD